MNLSPRDYTLKAAVAIGIVLGLAAQALAAPRIAVKEYSEVNGDKIMLGEVAVLTGMGEGQLTDLAGRSLGPAPKPDTETRLSRRQVESRIYNAGIEMKNFEVIIPDTVVFKRKATHVTGKDLTDFAAEFLRNNIVWPGGPVTIKVTKQPAEIVLPVGEVTMEGILDGRPNQGGAGNFRVDVYLNGEKMRTITLSNYIEVYGNVVTAAEPVPAGAFVGEQDVEVKEMPIGHLKAGVLADPAEAVGKKARHNVNKGDVITRDVLEVQPDVKVNDIVTIEIRGDGFTITTKGKALEKGYKGDLIRVLAIGYKKLLDGVILDPQTVEVIER